MNYGLLYALTWWVVTHPIVLPFTGWFFARIVSQELAMSGDINVYAEHLAHHLVGGLTDVEAAERRLRSDPTRYREHCRTYLHRRLPWVLPAELVVPVYRRTWREIDRRAGYFEALQSPVEQVDGNPVS